MRTRALLPKSVRLPDDIAPLVNAVYDEKVPIPEEPDGYVKAREKDELKRKQLENDAKSFRIHDPGGHFSTLLSDGVSPDEDRGRAQVRAGDSSLDVLLLTRQPSGELAAMPWIQKGRGWSTAVCPNEEDARTMLSQRISLPNGLVRAAEREIGWDGLCAALMVPESWRQSTWLRHTHLLILDDQLTADIGSMAVKYQRETGLEYSKRGDSS